MLVKYSQITLFCVCMPIVHTEFSELSTCPGHDYLKHYPFNKLLSGTQVLIFSKFKMVEQHDLQSLL